MSQIEDIVDSLERKIAKVLQKNVQLRQEYSRLQEEIKQCHQEITNQKDEIASWQEKFETLKYANSLLGSDENKRETKLKINALIREIDHCIAQLSE